MCDVDVDTNWQFGKQLISKVSDTRASIEYNEMLATPDFQAGCVSTVADRLGAGNRNTSPHPPKLHAKLVAVLHKVCVPRSLIPYLAVYPNIAEQTSREVSNEVRNCLKVNCLKLATARLQYQTIATSFCYKDFCFRRIEFDLLTQPIHVGLQRVGSNA